MAATTTTTPYGLIAEFETPAEVMHAAAKVRADEEKKSTHDE